MDTRDGTVYDNERLEITKKFWKFGEILYAYKSFYVLYYHATSFSVDSFFAYTYECK